MMNVTSGLVAYVVTAVLVFLFLLWYGIRTWSAFIFAIAIGLLVMLIVTPISSVDEIMQGEPEYGVYVVIMMITFLLILLYLVEKVFKDRAEGCLCDPDSGRLIPLS